MSKNKGGFTLPGEAGYEKLTLQMAKKWGADVIRDSDGTKLSPEITSAGYGIYSTICIIRDHNEWAKDHKDMLQQTFLMAGPEVACKERLCINLIKNFYSEQFAVNDSPEALAYYQVFDRTENRELENDEWSYDKETESVIIYKCKKWHKYTVNFLAYRIWEEISMYNHVTNNWDKEHLMQIDPRYPEVREYMLQWLKTWCEQHPETTVVRFTSMFYNFVWIWGSSERNRNLFTDWASYDFTVSPLALQEFEKEYGYRITSEDFINRGKLQVTHMPASRAKLDWMRFINKFVADFGRKLTDLVHQYGKQAYVFYDDSWVGIEPYSELFPEFGFDGLIKCVFSGYEVRLCSGVDVETHELRFHPYLFPVGLGGAPTFMEGGSPAADAREYWIHVRRALLRVPIQRIGLGGYLHLVQDFPDFCDYIEQIADEFRDIKELHEKGTPYRVKTKTAVLHYWGKMRSWTLSGHFHETDKNDLIHINEALSGLPVEVDFISFEDVLGGKLDDYQVVINAGYEGSAWSGGDSWKNDDVVEKLTEWVYKGGCLLGVGQPSAVRGYDTFFRMAHVFGIDEDTGARICHGKWQYEVGKAPDTYHNADGRGEVPRIPDTMELADNPGLYLTDGKALVMAESKDGHPAYTINRFGEGCAVYLSGFRFSYEAADFLFKLILFAGKEQDALYVSDNAQVETAYFSGSRTLVLINNSGTPQKAKVRTKQGEESYDLKEYELIIKALD